MNPLEALKPASLAKLALLSLLLASLLPSIAYANQLGSNNFNSTQWVPLAYSNCATTVVGGNTVFVNVSLSQLNTSGIYCSILSNYPWFSVALLLVVYISIGFLFSFLERSVRLLVIIAVGGFVFASILWQYGFLAPGIWVETLMFVVFSLIIYYLLSR